jgi:hypothetical protein
MNALVKKNKQNKGNSVNIEILYINFHRASNSC